MTFLPECGADKSLYFSRQKFFLLIKWVHNDFMYVRFAGMRNTKTWSKSRQRSKLWFHVLLSNISALQSTHQYRECTNTVKLYTVVHA